MSAPAAKTVTRTPFKKWCDENVGLYLRAMLFNAPSTINSYYASLVAHDMAQPDWGRPPNT